MNLPTNNNYSLYKFGFGGIFFQRNTDNCRGPLFPKARQAMSLIGIVGGVEIAVLFISIMIGYIIYAVGREKGRTADNQGAEKHPQS